MATTTEVSTAVPATFQPLHDRVREAMERHYAPGVAVGIMVDGVEHTAGFGISNVDYPAPVLADTLFQIGSTTKTVTATAMMRLVEEGRLDLNVPVRGYLPHLTLRDQGVADRVTMRDLVTHTAGWTGDFFLDTGRGDDALAKVVEAMAKLEQVTPLGEIWSYNNAAFYLAGLVIEAVTGTQYEAAVRELVLDPLGMTNSFFFPEEVMLRSFAVGHNVEEGKATVATPWPIPRSSNPAGGLASTAGDQLRYARFHMGDGTTEDGTRVLSAASVTQMQTPIVEAGEGTQVGLSWFLRDVEGVRFVQHGGGTFGQISLFEFVPERQFALTILTNAGVGGELNQEVEKWAVQHYLGLSEPAPVHQERSPEKLPEYTGRFVTELTAVDVRLEGDTLMIDYSIIGDWPGDTPPPPIPPTRVAFIADDRVIALDGPMEGVRSEFLRGSDGRIAWLRFGSRLHRRQS